MSKPSEADKSNEPDKTSESSKVKLKLYSDAITQGLDEYVHQEVSGFANRYYDVGKFLFTVSTFAIVAVLTLRSTFGHDYNSIFIANIFFFYCLWPSYKLTVGIDYEIKPLNTILKEYERKKEWMKEYLNLWAVSFGLGVASLVISFGAASFSAEESKVNKVEKSLQEVSAALNDILQEIKKDRGQPAQRVLPCDATGGDKLTSQLSGLSEQLSIHDAKVGRAFVEAEVHEDRHLQKIAGKINRTCSLRGDK